MKVAHEANFTFTSASKLHGLGWAMPFYIGDPGSSSQAAALVLFDIPFAGANSLHCRPGTEPNLEYYYRALEGKLTQPTLQISFATNIALIRITITYDLLQGTQQDPDVQGVYLYNSVIIIEKIG